MVLLGVLTILEQVSNNTVLTIHHSITKLILDGETVRSEDLNYTGYNENRGRNRSTVRKPLHTPRCIQIQEGRSRCYWLMDNGELYVVVRILKR